MTNFFTVAGIQSIWRLNA